MRKALAAKAARDILTLAPKLVGKPLTLVPFAVKASVLQQLLAVLLSEQVKDGELDFLEGQWVGVRVEDMELAFEVSFEQGFKVRPFVAPEVTFSANSAELLLVAAAKEDPDTLFFQRRLSIEGDTELGLEVKNLLLGIDVQSMPKGLKLMLDKLAYLLTTLLQSSQATPKWA